MSDFCSIGGEEFLSQEIKKREWLIENIIREQDSIILVGNEKSGKSVFTFQLVCSLTSKHPFIDKYKVLKPCRVTYIQLEGEKGDSQDRMKRMVNALDLNPDLFHYMFYPPLELHSKSWTQGFCGEVKKFYKDNLPDVIIIDPIYFAFEGSLSDDGVVRQFIGNLRILKDTLHCAIVLIHHTHKTRFNADGCIIDEGDDVIFGSRFLKAWADHLLLFTYDKRKEIRTLSCDTQRSGDIVKECNLRLVEPDPLYFEETKLDVSKQFMIINLLQAEQYKRGLSAEEIMEALLIGRNTFYNSVKQPQKEGIIYVDRSVRPPLYVFRGNEKGKQDGDTKTNP